MAIVDSSPKGSFIGDARAMSGPYRAEEKLATFPSPSGWADRNGVIRPKILNLMRWARRLGAFEGSVHPAVNLET